MKRCLLLCFLLFAVSCSRSTYHVKPSGTARRGMAGFRVQLGPDEMNALAVHKTGFVPFDWKVAGNSF